MTIKVEDDDGLTHQPRGFFPLVSDYDYDANGNLITDSGKDLEIDYNLLNLPTYIFNTDTHDEMLFEYAFGGEKLKKVSVIDDTTRTRLYMGGFEFLDDEPEAFHHEGRIVLTDSLPRFQFKIADHLGNTVVLFEDKDNSGTISTIIPQDPEDAEVVQRNLYYPFGMQLEGPWKTLTDPRADYLYNGKELEEELGLNWLAFGFRYADPAIGRFTGVDPIADQFAWVSPFNYAENEPVGHKDLWGLQAYKDLMGHLDPVYQQIVERDGVAAAESARKSFSENFVKGAIGGGGVMALGFVAAKSAPAVYTWAATNPESVAGLMGFIWGLGTDQDAPGQGDDVGRLVRKGAEGIAGNVTKLVNKIPEGKAANHIFSGKPGKFADTPENRALLENLSNDNKALQGIDEHGKTWYSRNMEDGTQIYTYTQNGIVKGGGVNDTPINLVDEYNLNKE